MSRFAAPVTPRLHDPVAEQARRVHDDKIRELQRAVDTQLGAGAYLGRQVFTASGTYTPATGARRAIVRMVGGGGGGGGAFGAVSGVSCGAGGNSGAYVEVHAYNVAGLQGGAVVIGAFGAVGSSFGGNGGAGGNTSITINGATYTAVGGSGGSGSTGTTYTGNANFLPTLQQPTTVGDCTSISLGGVGVVMDGSAWWSGGGGSSPFGTGGSPVGGNNTGAPGLGYGAGGAGGASSNVSHTGGAGSPGLCIVDEWG